MRPVIDVPKIDGFELGPTPMMWPRYPRLIARAIERNTFKTGVLLPLITVGLFCVPSRVVRERC